MVLDTFHARASRLTFWPWLLESLRFATCSQNLYCNGKGPPLRALTPCTCTPTERESLVLFSFFFSYVFLMLVILVFQFVFIYCSLTRTKARILRKAVWIEEKQVYTNPSLLYRESKNFHQKYTLDALHSRTFTQRQIASTFTGLKTANMTFMALDSWSVYTHDLSAVQVVLLGQSLTFGDTFVVSQLRFKSQGSLYGFRPFVCQRWTVEHPCGCNVDDSCYYCRVEHLLQVHTLWQISIHYYSKNMI